MDKIADEKKQYYSSTELKLLKIVESFLLDLISEKQSGIIDPMYKTKHGVIKKVINKVHQTAQTRELVAEQEKFEQSELKNENEYYIDIICRCKEPKSVVGEEKNEFNNHTHNTIKCSGCGRTSMYIVPNNWPDYYQYKLNRYKFTKISKQRLATLPEEDLNSLQEALQYLRFAYKMTKMDERRKNKRKKMILDSEDQINLLYSQISKTMNNINNFIDPNKIPN